jgi:hypothetical protein
VRGGVRRCARCGKELSLEGRPSRGATCPHCGAYLHSCVNCAFYSPGRHNDCREPQAEHVGDQRSANFCDFFRFREAVSSESGVQTDPDQGKNPCERTPGDQSSERQAPGGGQQTARERFDKLFGN